MKQTPPVSLDLARQPEKDLPIVALWHKLLHHPAAVVSLLFIIMLVVVAVFAPMLAPHNPLAFASGKGNLPPAWEQEGFPPGTWEYPLGTDAIGRDLLSRLIYGARTSLFVGVITMLLTVSIGVPIGLIGGFFGGWLDSLLMRITEVVYSFPALLFFIVVMASLRGTPLGSFWNGFPVLFAALALIGWADIARQVRAKTLSMRERQFVEASRALGASGWHMVWRHILPHAIGPVIVLGTYIIPDAIFTEAALSYLGLGLPLSTDAGAPFSVSWGSMIIEAQTVFATRPWQMVPSVLAVAMVTMAFTFLGDGLRDVLDPQESG
jgi:oligopeptide transport system permease protein